MLSALHIRNFAIIDDLEVDLLPGFTAITGETGAGKSILVGALGLLLGNRADSSAVRSGCDTAELSAEFILETPSAALTWLEEHQLQDETTCLLRRSVGSNGRSRAWINGTPVTMGQLQALGELLVEIHGQNEHLRLARPAEALSLLDAHPKTAGELAAVRSAWNDWQQLHDKLQQLEQDSPLGEAERQFLELQLEELLATAVTPEAYAELSREHQLLSRGGDLLENLQQAVVMLDGDDTREEGIVDGLQALIRLLARDAEASAEIGNAHQALAEALINCEEARHNLQSALAAIDLSPQQLQKLDTQMSQLHALARKHRCQPEELLRVSEALQRRLAESSDLSERRQVLQRELTTADSAYRTAARKLFQQRKLRAADLADGVTTLMQDLGMKGGSLQIELQHQADEAPRRNGLDRIELWVSANPGSAPGLLSKVASGGELSRLSLAIKVAAQSGQPATTQVFDEVDAGVGGDVAHAVGRLLARVATNGQALCVTHLAQVAVCADHQLRVRKSSDQESTRVATEQLDSNSRVEEIARMLGGRLTEQSRAHARELLSQAR